MTRRTYGRVPRLFALAAGITLALSACGGPASPASGSSAPSSGASASANSTSAPSSSSATAPIVVVGTENFYGDLLSQICGNRCAVTSILSDPNADPHEYESNAQDAAAVAKARLVIENGEGYDTFMDHLVAASPNPQRRVINVQTLIGAQNGANPHLWYDPATMPKVAAAAADALGRIDPAHAAEYQAAAQTYTNSLQAITTEIAAIKSAYPNAPVAYSEPVFGYMGDAVGLKVLTPETFQRAIEDGNDPSAADLAMQQDLLSKHQVKVLIYNLQTVTPVTTNIQNLAKQDGISVVGVSETEPSGKTYQQWMLTQLQALQAALGGGETAGGH